MGFEFLNFLKTLFQLSASIILWVLEIAQKRTTTSVTGEETKSQGSTEVFPTWWTSDTFAGFPIPLV